MYRYTLYIACAGAILLASLPGQSETPLRFDRDIRPILSDACFQCHGPDNNHRKAGIRLDTQEGILAAVEDGVHLVVPGDPDASLIMQRMESHDPDEVMPPPEAKKKFGEKERAILRRWIAEGATWAEHWAFIPPEKSSLPEVSDTTWPRNPIDHFIADKRVALGLGASQEATRETLIRRLSLDLTGLAPTPEQVDAFVADETPDAYAQLVERLLASPHYGERMAWPWLDAARYADTNGYQGDNERTMYPWRDWVVQAFNDNMPFDQFSVWQLAGDLLPDPTHEQRLATGFNRNHMINGEGGRIAEENRVEYIFDQLETVGTVWMGLTFNCCRCHDHKYDPLSKEDYYGLFAYYNQTPVTGAGGDPKTPPNLPIYDAATKERIAAIREDITGLRKEVGEQRKTLLKGLAAWESTEKERLTQRESTWSPYAVERAEAKNQTLSLEAGNLILASGDNPDNDTYTLTGTTDKSTIGALRLEAIRHESMTQNGLARSGSGNFVLTDVQVTVLDGNGGEAAVKIVSGEATLEQGDFKITKAFDDDAYSGWAVYEGKPFDKDHTAVLRFEKPIAMEADSTIRVVLDHQSPYAQHNLGHFRISFSAETDAGLAGGQDDALAALLAKSLTERSREEQNAVVDRYLKSDKDYDRNAQRLEQNREKLSKVENAAPRVMIMGDRREQRKTYVLNKGLYNQPQDEVPMAVPAVILEPAEDLPVNRLGMAQWLMNPTHPLTARVTVNRLWAQVFGQGLVKTTENFGAQGELPSHPELLDWLAVEFIESGWDVKHLMRLMVNSATYRQRSRANAQHLAVDPTNRYYARGPRYRMPSWMIRDQALQAGGLLVPKLGGRPVKPYQPDGLWQEFSFGKIKYAHGEGEDLYRRSLYTYWRRIVAPPMFFDAASRQTCTVKAVRTNTPLHALATLNDPTYVEAARGMAGRLLALEGQDDTGRIAEAFRIVLGRAARAEELDLLRTSLDRTRAQYTAEPENALAYVNVGESPFPDGADAVEHAAWANLCLALLNTDEALTKE